MEETWYVVGALSGGEMRYYNWRDRMWSILTPPCVVRDRETAEHVRVSAVRCSDGWPWDTSRVLALRVIVERETNMLVGDA